MIVSKFAQVVQVPVVHSFMFDPVCDMNNDPNIACFCPSPHVIGYSNIALAAPVYGCACHMCPQQLGKTLKNIKSKLTVYTRFQAQSSIVAFHHLPTGTDMV